MQNRRKAYTLVEVLVVLGVILVLSTIIIAVINPDLQRDRAKDAAVKKSVGDIATTIEIFKATYGRYPNTGDFGSLAAYISSGYVVYLYDGLIAFNSSGVETGSANNSIYWDPDDECLQGQLSELSGGSAQYITWSPNQEVSIGSGGCSSDIIAVISSGGDAGPISGGTVIPGASTGGGAPVGSEFSQTGGVVPALVGHYKMDDAEGATMADSSGKNNHGTVTVGVTRDIGLSETSIRLNSETQYGSIPTLFGNPRSVTLSAWVNPTAITSLGGEVVSIGDNVAVRIMSSSVYGFYNGGGTWPVTSHATQLVGKGWAHVAYVVDDANKKQRLYIDGELKTETSHSNGIVYSGLGANTTIGRHGNATINIYNLQGRIDEVYIYNYARTPSQITAEYNSIAANYASVSAPRMHLRLNESGGDTAFDTNSLTPSLNGNLGGSTVCPGNAASTCPTWNPLSGKKDGALSFDGTNDYVSVVSFPYMRIGSGYGSSYSFWVKTTSSLQRFIFAKNTDWGGSSYEFALNLQPNGTLRWLGGTTGVLSTGTINDGNWRHVVVVADGTNLHYYIDGVHDSTHTIGSNAEKAVSLLIGARRTTNSSTIDDYFPGLIDEVRIFNYALSPAQIVTEYHR